MFQLQISAAAILLYVVVATHARSMVDEKNLEEFYLNNEVNEADYLTNWRLLDKREPRCFNKTVTIDLGRNAIPRYVTEIICDSEQPNMQHLGCSPNVCQNHTEQLRYVVWSERSCAKLQIIQISKGCRISENSGCFIR